MSKETGKQPMFSSFDENVDYLKKRLGADISFDVIHLDLEYAGRRMAMFMIDGFVKDEILHYLMKLLSELEPDQLEPDPFERLLKTHLPYVELDHKDDLNETADWVLAGPTALVVEGIDNKVILIDARTYPVRGPSEPDTERVVRGARDGYVETIIFNTALTRRRVRDRSLRMEYMQIGRRSKTDICLCYIEDIVDDDKVAVLKEHLELIDTDGLPMAEKTVEEYLSGRHWNPYPTVRYTERPDTAAAHLYEGHILIMIDGSPSVMITPATFWHHLQHAEEYRQKPSVGAYLRMVRYFGVLASIVLLPLYYLLSINEDLVPEQLSYLGPEEIGALPLIMQFLIAEIGIDLLRLAAIHIPSALGTALGLVATILLGEVGVKVGLFSSEVVLYLSIAAIGTYATPSYELSLANRMSRLLLLIVAGAFGVIGYVIGLTVWLLYLSSMKTFRTSYLWPFLPFNLRAFRDIFLRAPMPLKNRRPAFLNPKDPDR
ncbi:stage V sporulation protein AF [Pontibacillus halophilus JSM 076056 = DSM 19796]|uniref:Stage V sporulation protein AF n=1 Tax=Pontibacillus halophilus JSM 076056 = DSM 19796 TaxID=1385510 RepID=A0A0A5I4V6_9BACI|nr:spore germination protein [Pontibacillus halophilus]KGX90867.1 stage V sporulation protein AF [Pontibacillus halophilus JSM 076056 = DSM 19796]